MISKEIDIQKSINLYSNNIKSEFHSFEDYINLILIYWNASFDYGFGSYCITQGIFSEDDILNLPKEVEVLFDKAFSEFPHNKELLFWNIYIYDLSNYSDCFHKSAIQDFLKIEDFFLPYFYFYVQCNIIIKDGIEKLKLDLVNEKSSYKKYYILSYLNNI